MSWNVRSYLYRIITAAAPLAIAYGLIEHDAAGLWIGFAGAVLSVGGNALAASNTKRDGGRHRDNDNFQGRMK